MAKKYDVIVIGAGPNGLSAATYLSKAGLKVLILEKKTEAGGGMLTEELTLPKFLHNTHSIFHMMVDYAPVYHDLELEAKYNLRYVRPELQFAMPLLDGRSVCLYTDPKKTCQSFAQFSAKDAETYARIHEKFAHYMSAFLAPATYVPPHSPIEAAAKLDETQLGREILSYSEMCPRRLVEELFENEHIRALMLYVTCHWGLDPELDGLGYLAVLYMERATHYQLCVGGSHMLSQTINKALIENGGMIHGSQRIKRIVVEGGRATGVELEDGTIIEAEKAVLSTLDPHQTFLNLVGRQNLDKDFVEKIGDWMWEKWSLFSQHIALKKTPTFKAAAANADLNKALVYLVGYESMQDVLGHFDAISKGELSDGFLCTFPSVHDPSQAPSDRATGLISQMAPYDLKAGKDKWLTWKFKEAHGARLLKVLERYAPDASEHVLWMNYHTPADIENKFVNMVKGSIKHGAYHPFQQGFMRPHEECSDTRTMVKNLYVGGASTHPGGLVIFGPGYLAANAIADDNGVQKWWSEPAIVTKARAAGLI